jgi:hypothetical protein
VAVRWIPHTPGRTIEQRIGERPDDAERLVEGVGHRKQGSPGFSRVPRLPQGTVGRGDSGWQADTTSVRLRSEGRDLSISGDRHFQDDRHEIDEVLVAGRGHPGRSMRFVDGTDLVGDMVNERVGHIAMLFDVRHHDASQRRHLLGLTGHPEIRSSDVDVEGGPRRRADVGGHRKPDPTGVPGEHLGSPQFEAEPVT